MTALYDLKVEYLTNPIGIDAKHPRFSWKIESKQQNVMQSTWRICAFSNDVQLWDSGVVQSSKSQQIRYQGPELRSRQLVHWQVTVTVGDETIVSEIANFEMGLLEQTDWLAQWIVPEDEIDIDARKPAPYLRREFNVKPGLKQARIYQSAHGLYEFWLNGQTGTEDKFKPGLTSYYSRIQYQCYDITSRLQTGSNVWAVVLGDGWWRGATGGTIKNNFGYKLHFFGQMELLYEDGSSETVTTDKAFKTSIGGLLCSDMQMGEIYDARQEPIGWKLSGFDDSNWSGVNTSVEHADSALIPSRSVPVREMEQFDGVVFRDGNDDLVLDFGQNIAGYVKMRLRGCAAGQTIRLTHGEEIKDNCFSIEHINKTVLPMTAFQEVAYICSGAETETYYPLFAVFGFRFVKVEGYQSDILPGDFVSVAVYSDMEDSGSFTCSNPLINQLVENSKWSQKGNFLDVPVDCPTRERNAWTGDNQVYVRTAANFMNVYSFYEKWLQDMVYEQYDSGKIGITFPSTSSHHNIEEFKRLTNPIASLSGPLGPGSFLDDSTGWGDAAAWLPFIIYLCYGDRQILENQYDTARKWADYQLTCARKHNPIYEGQPQYNIYTDGVLDADYIYDTNFHFGEWLEPIPAEGQTDLMTMIQLAIQNGNPLVATAYMCRSCDNVSAMAKVLGKTDEAEHYDNYAKKIRKVYEKYLIPEDGVLQPGHQAPYVRVLAMNLCTEDKRAKIVTNLIDEIEKNNYKLNTGFLSTPFLLPVLVDSGNSEIAFRILEQTESPSWLHPVLMGSTTIPEMWDGLDKHEGSYNHYSYGAVSEFLFGRIAGIQPVWENPGYRHFLLRPVPGGTLAWAKAEYQSPYGLIHSSWQRDGGEMKFFFRIPANTTASVHLPNGRQEELGSGQYEFSIQQ